MISIKYEDKMKTVPLEVVESTDILIYDEIKERITIPIAVEEQV